MSDRENDGTAITRNQPTGHCVDCGEPYWSWGSHAERCFGRPARVCECPPGWRHESGCIEVTGDDAA